MRKGLMVMVCLLVLPALFHRHSAKAAPTLKKIVLIAGKKTHGPGEHEYLKSVRLLKVMLDNAPNLKGIKTEMHFNGWPTDPLTLNDADVIVMYADGTDYKEESDPLFAGDHWGIIEKQMKRGCGLVVLHYSTFSPVKFSQQFMEWSGGFFDYESGKPGATGREAWYSDIKTETATVRPENSHPIAQGVPPFELHEEFYFKIHFQENDKRLKPVLKVSIPGVDREQTIAWAVERKDGGRGFGFTGGHFYNNWEVPNYRKLILNAIVWTAGVNVPAGGVESKSYTDQEVNNLLYGKPIKGLILTGYHSIHHPWQETTAVIKTSLELDPRIQVSVSTDIEDLANKNLREYDFLVLNYNNWDKPGLSDRAKENFAGYLSKGGGLIIVHFADGAFHFSLPAGASGDWPEFRKICRRVWDHTGNSSHDPYGKFQVDIVNSKHPITKDIKSFETSDELYFQQKGDLPIEPLITAHSKVTGKDEPLAWAYNYDKGKIFQMLLGHDAVSLKTPGVNQLLVNAAVWISNREPVEY